MPGVEPTILWLVVRQAGRPKDIIRKQNCIEKEVLDWNPQGRRKRDRLKKKLGENQYT